MSRGRVGQHKKEEPPPQRAPQLLTGLQAASLPPGGSRSPLQLDSALGEAGHAVEVPVQDSMRQGSEPVSSAPAKLGSAGSTPPEQPGAPAGGGSGAEGDAPPLGGHDFTRVQVLPPAGEAIHPLADAALAEARRSQGEGLPVSLRSGLEQAFGADLQQVRLHTGPASARVADAVKASAFALGPDIHFAAGAYDPATPAGTHRLAHEVAHVIQRSEVSDSTAQAPAAVQIAHRSAPEEQQARRAADHFLSLPAGEPATGALSTFASPAPGLAMLYRDPQSSVADPNRIPILPHRQNQKWDEVERNWMAEITPASGPIKLEKLSLVVNPTPPTPPFDLERGTREERPEPLGTQRITRAVAWATIRADVAKFEEGFNEMVEPHNMFHNAQEDPSLAKLPFHFQRLGPGQKATLPESGGKQKVAGGPEGQTVDDAFTPQGKLSKPGDAKALEEMSKNPDIMAARGKLKEAEAELEAHLSTVNTAVKGMNEASLAYKNVAAQVQVEEQKEETERRKQDLDTLKKNVEKLKGDVGKKAEAITDITINLMKSLAGDAASGAKAVEGGIKMAVGAVAEEVVGAVYSGQIAQKTKAFDDASVALQQLVSAEHKSRLAAAQAKVDTSKAKYDETKNFVVAAIDKRRNALTHLGVTMAKEKGGATDPAERERIAGLIQAQPIVELVASRAASLRMVAMKAQNVPYSLASGIGFNILGVNQRDTADKFVRNCGILVGVTQEAMAAEQEWKERAKSIQSMIEQIGQAPALPGVPAP